MNRHRRRCGFLMIEIMVALALLAVFALIASRLFTASIRVIGRSSQQIDAMVRFDGMMRALRADVWSAERIEEVADGSLRLRSPVAGDVRWTIDTEGRFTRTAAGEELRVFPSITPGARFARLGGAVAVVVQGEPIVLPNLKEMTSR
jgi:prepilin-type N-terminal cleavage/methylation domain-containing protein